VAAPDLLGPPLKCQAPRPPAPARRPKRWLSWDFVPYGTSHSTPRHRPPSGFPAPSRRFAPLRAWRRPVGRRSAHGVHPSGSCSSRPAVPLSGPRLSCRFLQPPRTGVVATPEVDSDREGARLGPARGGDGRTLPSWVPPLQGFLLTPPLNRLPGPKPLIPFRPEVLPTFPLPGGVPGDLRAAEAAGLSRDCRPSWGFAPSRANTPLWAAPAPGLWLRLGPRKLASEDLLGAAGVPDRSLVCRRIGATFRTRHPTPITCQKTHSLFRGCAAHPLPRLRGRLG